MNNRVEILPAILPQDFAELKEKIGMVKDYVKTIQIDVCDGQFSPKACWPYKKHDDDFEKIIHEDEGFPGWEDVNFEIDLMANKPEDLVENWVIAGASRIIIHVESKGDAIGAINKLAGRVEVGLALNIETPIEMINDAIINDQGKDPEDWAVKSIQLMGINHVGFQGEPFDERVIEKVKAVRAKYPEMIISVDGGVSLETAPKLIEAGVSRLIVGSAIFNSDNFIESIQNFKKLSHM